MTRTYRCKGQNPLGKSGYRRRLGGRPLVHRYQVRHHNGTHGKLPVLKGDQLVGHDAQLDVVLQQSVHGHLARTPWHDLDDT
jgi:hypothetical protein